MSKNLLDEKYGSEKVRSKGQGIPNAEAQIDRDAFSSKYKYCHGIQEW